MRGLYLRGKTYWFAFKRAGHYYRASTGETDEAKAIVVARAIREQPEVVAGDHLYREIDAYVGQLKATNRSANYYENIRSRLSAWAKEIGPERLLAEVTQADMQAWFNAKRKTVMDYTAVAYLDDIRRFFKWALEKRKVRSNPCQGILEPQVKQRHRDRWIDKEAAAALLHNCTNLELKYCLYCAIHTGLRKDEVVMSRPRWFNLERGFIRIPAEEEGWKPKDGASRSIPLSPKFQAFLSSDYPLRGPFMIAPKVQKGDWRYRYDFRTRFKSYVRSQGLELTFHDLRRSFASILVSEGASVFKVAEWLGDDVSLVQKVYGHLAPENRQEVSRIFG